MTSIYRGYTLHHIMPGTVHIWYGDDLVSHATSTAQAHGLIDRWQDAR